MNSNQPSASTIAYQEYVAQIPTKVKQPRRRIFLAAVMAGIFLTLAAHASVIASSGLTVTGLSKVLTGLVFSSGLIMIVLSGSELFTGNCLFWIGVVHRQFSLKQLFQRLGLVYLGNLLGAMIIVLIIFGNQSFALNHEAISATLLTIATTKTNLSFSSAVASSMLCNFLVCTAVWLSASVRSHTEKIFSIIFPITVFIIGGFEHCIANFYYLGASLLLKREIISLMPILVNNLLPVTIGNILGGIGLGCLLAQLHRHSIKT